MISILADIIGIISGIIAIFSYMQNQKNKKIDQSQVNIIYNMRSSTYVSTVSDTPFFDGETTLFLWGIFFLSGIYIYEHYRYWIMVAASILFWFWPHSYIFTLNQGSVSGHYLGVRLGYTC